MRGKPGYATLASLSPVSFLSGNSRREECHALGRPLHRPLPHAEGAGHAADAGRRRRRAGNLLLGGDPRRDHPGRGGNRRGDAAGRGDPLPVVPCPLRGRVARRARRGARRFAVRRIAGAIALAPSSAPPEIVLHGGYYDWIFDFQPEKWFAPARRSFGELAEAAEKAGTDLFVENVFDEIPDHLLRLREAVGSSRPPLLLRSGPRDALLPSAGPEVGRKRSGGDPPDARARQPGTAGRSPPGRRGGNQLPGGAAGGTGRGVRPILTVEPHRKDHFARSVAGLRAILATIWAPPIPSAIPRGSRAPPFPSRRNGRISPGPSREKGRS